MEIRASPVEREAAGARLVFKSLEARRLERCRGGVWRRGSSRADNYLISATSAQRVAVQRVPCF